VIVIILDFEYFL